MRLLVRLLPVLAGLLVPALEVRASPIPDWLPLYDLGIQLDIPARLATVQERVTWTNRHARPADRLVLNVYPRYKVADDEVVVAAKTLELLRARPADAIDSVGRRLTVQKVMLGGQELPFSFRDDMQTAMEIPLPRPVKQGESVTVDIDFTLSLPEKQGRWGHWKGITYLANWYPTLAYYDDGGWQPTPFIGWHQPFFNEAGVYSVRLELPADQKIASTGQIHNEEPSSRPGWKLVNIVGCCARDFALVCSSRFVEFTGQAEKCTVRVLALPEHEHHARNALQFACEVIPLYNRWFGIYPYEEFDIVESNFPWNGNECSGLIMLDERVLGMPHIGEVYVDHLVSHETLHQWWYNVVGTNGYAETWMDEGVASYYTARRLQMKYGHNAPMIRYPKGYQWLPNLRHEDYRFSGMYGTLARNEQTKTVQPLPDFGNLVTLFSMTYDRGAKVLGMIEAQIGEQAFYDFMKLVYSKYQFRILRVADYQRELEAYTGRSWEEFFQNWLYGKGMSDWAVDGVEIVGGKPELSLPLLGSRHDRSPCTAVVAVRQNGEFSEPTVVGVKFERDGPYEIRVPIRPGVDWIELDDPPARVEALPGGGYLVTIPLPARPAQVSVDPDQVLLDREPANNHWKPECAFRFAPVYTPLEETDLTTPYDRHTFIIGPWAGVNAPQFGQQGYIGGRAGLYRLQQCRSGVYAAYNLDEEDIRAGVDAVFDHVLHPYLQWGFRFDRSLTPDYNDQELDRFRIFGRYILHYTPSLYQDQMEFVELYGRIENVFWQKQPDVAALVQGIDPLDDVTGVGIRYVRNYLTPYWDPDAGYRLDVNYECGLPLFVTHDSYNQVQAQLSWIHSLPDGLGYLSATRLAFRLYGGAAVPDNGQNFQLGGNLFLRGLDPESRQGSLVWIASAEWRFPIWKDADWDLCDHVFRLRNLYGAAFVDVGEIYVRGQNIDGVAIAPGLGLRLDTAVFSFVERLTLRFDVATVANGDGNGVQFWFGIQQPF